MNITANDVVKYLCKILNVDMTDKLFMMDMLEDLETIESLPSFRIFVKERFSYERYKFLTGDQKFIKLVQDYKKENIPVLDEVMMIKSNKYSSNLFSKLTTLMDEVNFELQIKARKIEDLNLVETLTKNGFEKHHIAIINQLGSKSEVFKLCIYGKEALRARIESIVNKKALVQQHPQLQKKSEDVKVLEMLKAR